METLITVAGIAALYLLNALLAYVLAWLLTEKIKPVFNFKPFTCRGCMSFWFTFIFGSVMAVIVVDQETQLTGTAGAFARWFLYGWAFLTGIINYLYINAKFKIYE